MIADRDTNIIYFSELIKNYSVTYNQIKELLDSLNISYGFLPLTKDIWARDYMPIQISDNKFVEYRYDPDYLQGEAKGYRNLKTYTDIVCEALNLKTIKSDIILDGGNVVKSSKSIILTDKIVRENRHLYTKKELINQLRTTFEIENVILIPWDKSEEFGHADGMVRFIDDQTVLIQGYFDTYKDSFKRKFFAPLRSNKIQCERLKFNTKKPDIRNWAYMNFCQTKDLILLPSFGIDEEDERALEQIKKWYPGYATNDRIKFIKMPEIIEQGGALNCISWTIKRENLLI